MSTSPVKSFNFNGVYVSATSIATIKPAQVGAYDTTKWEITLFNNRIFYVETANPNLRANNLELARELSEYFGIPIVSAKAAAAAIKTYNEIKKT